MNLSNTEDLELENRYTYHIRAREWECSEWCLHTTSYVLTKPRR